MPAAARGSARFAALAAACLAVAATAGAAHAQSPQDEPNPLIIGGEDAEIADHPFTVALTDPSGSQFCGGSLVAPDKVLTAAHCTEGEEPSGVQVVSGRTEMSSQEGTVSEVTDIWSHPEYGGGSMAFDVSVLTLAEPVAEAPAELAAPDDPAYAPDTDATILGWGTTSEGGETSDHLQKAVVPVNADETCSAAYPEYTPDGMVCAGFPEGGTDACQGDSGGPMVVDNRIIGVTSFGNGCARPDNPGVYARVGSYHDELQEQIG